MRQRTAQNLHTDNVLHKTYIQTTYCTEPIYRQRTAQNLHTDNLLHRTYIQTTYCTEPTYRQPTAQNLHTENVLHRTYIQTHNSIYDNTHNATKIITSLHSFHFFSLHITSIHCTSLHFTQYFSLPCNLEHLLPNICVSK